MIHFFALYKDKRDNYKKYIPHIKAMVNSAKENTNLESYFIYDGKPDKLTRWLDKKGIKTIFYRSMLYDFFNNVEKRLGHVLEGFKGDVAKGAFLRLDIPIIMDTKPELNLYKHGEFVLYTDCDVVFEKDPISSSMFLLNANKDKVFLISKEFNYKKGENEYYNTGVMFMNVPVYKQFLPELRRYIISKLSLHQFGDYDQRIVNLFFHNKFGELPDTYNHRPYNGIDTNAIITHYHGLKYHQINECIEKGKCSNELLNSLYNKDTKAFQHYFDILAKYLNN